MTEVEQFIYISISLLDLRFLMLDEINIQEEFFTWPF